MPAKTKTKAKAKPAAKKVVAKAAPKKAAPAKKAAPKAAPKASKPVAKKAAPKAVKKTAHPVKKSDSKAAVAKAKLAKNLDIIAARKTNAAKSGKRSAAALAPKVKPAPKAAPKATKKKASKAAKPSVGKSGKTKQADPRLIWAPQPVENARWYVAQSASNYEKRVQTLIREQVLLQGMQRFVEDVLIPTEPVVEIKKGVKVTTDRKFFPGYVLIKCNLTDDVWHLIRYTPHVTGFLGSERGKKPYPITETEAQRILNVMVHGAEKPRSMLSYEVGENVRVTEGPFANFQGAVELVDEDKERLTVSVSIFGRATPIELDYNQVEKA